MGPSPSAFVYARRGLRLYPFESFLDVSAAHGSSHSGAAASAFDRSGFDLRAISPMFEPFIGKHGLSERVKFHAEPILKPVARGNKRTETVHRRRCFDNGVRVLNRSNVTAQAPALHAAHHAQMSSFFLFIFLHRYKSRQ